MDIHNTERKLKDCINKFLKDSSASPKNKQLILDFLDSLQADGLSQIRVLKYLYTMKQVATFFSKDFNRITKKDAIQFFKHINTNKDFEEWTKHDYCILTRRFYQWLEKEVKKTSKETKEAILRFCDIN